jgi:hypothetical protein
MRTRICLYVLLLLPLAVYWQTIFADYGIRDDYGFLRAAHEEPSKLVKHTASHGRPLYGALLESTYAATGQVDQLPWMRLASVLLLTVLSVVLWRQLYNSGWNEVEAAAIGLGVTLLPSAQFIIGSAACWPQALTLLLAMAGFSAIETEIERGGMKRLVALVGGCMIYTAAGLIYQSNVLFALVPLTAVYLVRTGREPISDIKWGLIHVATMATGLLLGYALVQSLFSNGVFEASARLHFETNPFTKLLWFFSQPLPNGVALFAVADDNFHGVVIYGLTLLVIMALLGFAFRRSIKLVDEVARQRWKVSLFGLPFLVQTISLVAAEDNAGYRTIFALAGLVLVLTVFASRALLEDWKIKARVHYPVLGVIFLLVAFTANRHSYQLIAEPQANEWDMMKGAALRANFNKALRVFIILPTADDRSTERIYRDEFGSVSSATETVAQEMFKAAVRSRYPGKLPAGSSYTLATSLTPPEAGTYDLLIDMRKLKTLRGL